MRPSRTPAEVFADAADETRERLRRDARLFPGDPEMTALFARLEEKIFDASLDVALLLASSSSPRAVRERFTETLETPKAYVEKRRIAAAARLVRETDADFRDVARQVGYDRRRTFRRAFRRVTGMSATEMRRQARTAPHSAAPDSAPEEPAAAAGEELSPPALAWMWRRRIALALGNAEQAAELRQLLRRLYPNLRRPGPWLPVDLSRPPPVRFGRPLRLQPTDDELETRVAETVLERLLELPPADLRHAVAHGVRFHLAVGFDLLCEKCHRLIGEDRERALRLAELLLELVDSHVGWADRGRAEWQALAWTRLGRLRLAAGELAGAELALICARAEWAERFTIRREELTGRSVEAEMCRLEAALRTRQRRYGEAVRALDEAVESNRASFRRDAFWIECVLERADLLTLDHRPWRALETLAELDREPLAGDESQAWRAWIAFQRARAHAAYFDEEPAMACFREARELAAAAEGWETSFSRGMLAARLDHEEARFYLRRSLDEFSPGNYARGADLLRSAARRFAAAGEPIWAASASAELAVVSSLLGRHDEVEALVGDAVDVFRPLAPHREVRLVVVELRVLPGGGGIQPEELDDFRGRLDVIVREIPPPVGGARGEDA